MSMASFFQRPIAIIEIYNAKGLAIENRGNGPIWKDYFSSQC